MSKVKIGEQIASVRKAYEIVFGAVSRPAIARERDYLAACLLVAASSLEWIRDNEAEVREFVAARRGEQP